MKKNNNNYKFIYERVIMSISNETEIVNSKTGRDFSGNAVESEIFII